MEKFEYNGFAYIKEYDDDSTSIMIEHSKPKPKNIFKFYGISKYSIDALVEGYFYASHPFELNDILDSSYFLFHTSKPLNFEYYDKLLGILYKDKLELMNFYKKDVDNGCHSYIYYLWQTLTNILGIISTTARENNILMWPHYTQEKGFRIKFNTTKLEKSISGKLTKGEEYLGLFPVNYSPSLHPIDLTLFKQMFIPLYYATTIKSDQWKYEDEWRFLIGKQQMGVPNSKSGFSTEKDYEVNKKNRYVFYDKNIVDEITLGRNFFNGADFEQKRLDAKTIQVKPRKIKANWEFDSQKKLLTHLANQLGDRLYVSGVKYELDSERKPFLIRTKERMLIEEHPNGYFRLTRTNEVIKFMS